jgi:cysteine synthase A
LFFFYLVAGLMDSCNGFIEAIGNTPLIRLKAASAATGCEILGKAEFMNPGGSVKDRAAWWMIREAEKNGSLQPGGTVVEGTAGNTGIGIAHICNARGYSCVIYMPDNQSPQKVEILETLGAEVRVVPTVSYQDEMNYQKQANRYAQSVEAAVWVNQFDNIANRLAHYESTGPEIWQQTDGKVDAFCCAVGTGGTLAGVSKFLKQQNQQIKLVLLDCLGSALFNFVTTGEASMSEGTSITEGIGNSRITGNLADTQIDWALQLFDQDMIDMVYSLLREEGWFFGSSTGINVCGAVQVARELGPGHTVVTMLCDGGGKYQSRLFNEAWLAEKGFQVKSAM